MKDTISRHLPQHWSEAHRRAETYLRALGGEFGPIERKLAARALAAARAERRPEFMAHPVTLVMRALFSILAHEKTAQPVAMTPPIQRTTMLPEPTEFPLHDWLGGLFRGRSFKPAGAR
ncbi:MAG: hypothetical protein M3Q86_06355 [Verrucomicrobiota bacterium]|jgi:hypothetical protein|nr:hypothetical protein [Verrucomicrobiota bacterium]